MFKTPPAIKDRIKDGSVWVVMDTAHKDCEQCLDQAFEARTMAKVTGSVGARQEVSATTSKPGHWANVKRAEPIGDGFAIAAETGISHQTLAKQGRAVDKGNQPMSNPNELADRIDAFLLEDALNCLVTYKATREELINRGDELAKALREALDHIRATPKTTIEHGTVEVPGSIIESISGGLVAALDSENFLYFWDAKGYRYYRDNGIPDYLPDHIKIHFANMQAAEAAIDLWYRHEASDYLEHPNG